MMYKTYESREMFPIKCESCGKDSEVPFKPIQGRPLFCRECYRSRIKVKYEDDY